ncbi:MAG: helix-turn-helix transcriptional regulator [Proteobacteria bacterium]|nr:helix-turn-helix transcriptional regulator [Pseudomonadota bacterium]
MKIPAGNLNFALLGLVAARSSGVHGYQLKTEFEALCEDFWQLNYGRLYRALDNLETSGELVGEQQVQIGRPNRKVYRITSKGEQSLDDWLLQPLSDEPRPLRDELSLRLLFLRHRDPLKVQRLVREQRAIYMSRLARVARRRRKLDGIDFEATVTRLVMDGLEMRVKADLSWLDHVEHTLLEEMAAATATTATTIRDQSTRRTNQ